jgi:hypothetical protein
MTEITKVDSVRHAGNQPRKEMGDDGLHGTPAMPVVTGILERCATETPRILSDKWKYKLAMSSSQVLDCFSGEFWAS